MTVKSFQFLYMFVTLQPSCWRVMENICLLNLTVENLWAKEDFMQNKECKIFTVSVSFIYKELYIYMLSLPLTHSQRETILQNRWVQLCVCLFLKFFCVQELNQNLILEILAVLAEIFVLCTLVLLGICLCVADLFPYVKVVPCAVKIQLTSISLKS